MTDIEIWKTAVYDGEVYEGLYKVSNLGKILSLNYKNTGKSKLMTPVEIGNGYLRVKLYKNKEYKKCLVHRLIAQTFLPNPEKKPCINHKIEGDEGKKINMVFFNEDGTIDKERTTIEWATYEENSNYATRNERISKAMTNGKTSKPVLQFTKSGDFIREWPSTMEIQRQLGYDNGNISHCCLGNTRLKTYKGYIWKYKETL